MDNHQNSDYRSTPVAVVGSGYWGKNHVRNFHQLGALTHICDSSAETLGQFAQSYPDVSLTQSFDEILEDQSIKGVVIATPAVTHYELASRALRSGKDVLVEKPLALSVEHGEELVNLASKGGNVLMVGHILLYHPCVAKLKEMIAQGELGKIQYIQSNRLSLGKVRSEENILWSFAPHDISMVLYLLGEMPIKVYASGYCHLQRDVEDVTISVMEFGSGVGAHIYVSWMNPFKEQRLVVMGDKGTAVFEDSRPEKKLRVYRNSFEWIERRPVPLRGEEEPIEVEHQEPLRLECSHFLDSIISRSQPRSDGGEGLRTLRVLQKCYESMKKTSTAKSGHEDEADSVSKRNFFAHGSSVIDDPCEIGEGTSIWHFSHVMSDARIGKNCRIGQNVLIGKGVQIGDNCKIQNNVSIYEGVTLEDHVFCGPSMVFTNVYNPRCEIPRMSELRTTMVKRGATFGANSTVLCGITVGDYAFIGAGAVVLNDVPDYALVAGNPAITKGWMCRCGTQLDGDKSLKCPACGEVYERVNEQRILHRNGSEQEIRVPLLDLKRQFLSIESEINQAIAGVLETQRFIGGPEVEALEQEVAAYCECRFGIGVSSGTDALLLSLMALGIGPGDEVITTPFTFFATVGSILRLGATPVFVDIDPDTFNIDPDQIRNALTENTKAILPVHLFGQCAEMEPILDIANEHGIPVVEDAAQAIGAVYKGRRAGSMGTFGCFSFFPSKNLGAFGDGGMITTNDEDLAEKARIIRNQGAKPKYFHKLVGGNFRLDAIQAAIIRVKLRYLDSWTRRRMENAAFYTRRFEELGLVGNQVVPPPIIQEEHVFNQYVIRVHQRDGLKRFLKDNGVDSEIYYPRCLHLQECLAFAGYNEGSLQIAEQASQEVLALPIYPDLTHQQKEVVVRAVQEYLLK